MMKCLQNLVNVQQGVWRLERDNFLRPATIPEWAVLNLNPRTDGHKIKFVLGELSIE